MAILCLALMLKFRCFDSGYLVGDGVWEGIRLHHGVLVFLDEHLDRLFQGAKAIAMDIGMTRAELTAALHQTVQVPTIWTIRYMCG